MINITDLDCDENYQAVTSFYLMSPQDMFFILYLPKLDH